MTPNDVFEQVVSIELSELVEASLMELHWTVLTEKVVGAAPKKAPHEEALGATDS